MLKPPHSQVDPTARHENTSVPLHRLWWLIPQPFDLVSTTLYISAVLPFIYDFIRKIDYTPPIAPWQILLMSIAITALLLIDRVEYWFYRGETSRNSAIFLLSARVFLIEICSWLDKISYTPFLYFVVLFLACLYFGAFTGYGIAILAWIVYILKHMYYEQGWLSNGTELHYLVLFTVGCAFAVITGRVVAREKGSRTRTEELLKILEASHQQLHVYSQQIEELSTTRERNRLAREIHDSLGHYLTVIIVQLEKALVFRDKKPPEADQAVIDAKRLAGEALQDVRRSVSTLREKQELQALTPSISRLAENMRNDHCKVELQITGVETNFSPQSLLTLYRAVQEGLTNIQKHARADLIWIALCFDTHDATLTVRDNGRGFDTALTQGRKDGYGLCGLHERLELLGGQLKITSSPDNGTTLQVTVPKNTYTQNDTTRNETG